MIPEHIKNELKHIVGEEYVALSPSEMKEFSSDGTKLEFLPDAVVFPEDAMQVSKLLELANKEKIPVIPRGAGTGMSGGALPVRGGIIMGMDRMNRIIYLDRDNMISKVEPGVITEELQKEAKKIGLFYPPYPASANISTIGGNVAECAGGLRALKYGVTRDYVLGLKIVLPTGEILETGTKTVKGVVGYDLTRLIIGSEGTLAVITEVLLRLVPAPEYKKSMAIFFKEIETSIKGVIKILQFRIIPSILEFLDDICLDCIKEDLYIPASANSMLMIELDGPRSLVMEEAKKVKKICQSNGAIYIDIIDNEQEEKKLWETRNQLSHYMYKLRPHKISEDIVVPRNNIPKMVSYIKSLSKEYGMPIPVFGHAGDGNLHVNIMLNKDNNIELIRAKELIPKLFKKVIELHGTISGEHGIGITKAPYMGMEVPRTGIELMRRIKKAFDPNDILNPGKIFWEGGSSW